MLVFAPSAESGKILLRGDAIASALSQSTRLKFKAIVPTSYAAVVEAMCAGQVDAMIALYQRQGDSAASFIDAATDVPSTAVKSLRPL